MNPIKDILVIVDPTAPAHPAVEKGATLARVFDARLNLYACDTRSARESRLTARAGTPLLAEGLRTLQPLLEKIAEPLRKLGLEVTTEVETGDPLVEMLVSRLKRSSADLVIKDTHHHSLARRTFMTNTDWELIRCCPSALLLTRAAPWAPKPCVVAAVDPGHINDKPALLDDCILEYAATLTKRLGGDLHALHAYIPIAVIAAAVGANPPMALAVTPEELAREQHEKMEAVASLSARFEVLPEHVHVRAGGPGSLLPHVARDLNADIMVMGAISRSGLRRAFIGSTAEQVLEHLPCDALVIKPPDFSEALIGLCP